jgi:hypothetical protein
LPAPTTMMYMAPRSLYAPRRSSGRRRGRARGRRLEHVDRDPGRADRVQPWRGTTRPAAGRGCGRSRSAPRSGAGRSAR